MAVAPTTLVRVDHRRNAKQPSRELGADDLDRINADQRKRSFLKRREQLGVQVTVQNQENVSPLQIETAIFEGDPANEPADLSIHDPVWEGRLVEEPALAR